MALAGLDRVAIEKELERGKEVHEKAQKDAKVAGEIVNRLTVRVEEQKKTLAASEKELQHATEAWDEHKRHITEYHRNVEDLQSKLKKTIEDLERMKK